MTSFEEVAAYRDELRAHCYRLLGSMDDAEDAVQETLQRAWRNLDGFEGSLRPWLYKIATNRALTLIGQRKKPVELGPPMFVESAEAQVLVRESVELAFVAAIHHLTPTQRAALLLRDVLGYSAREAADMLGTSPTAVHSAVRRARAVLAEQDSLGEEGQREAAARYAEAWTAGDLEAIVSMLTDDARFTMPPFDERYHGHPEIRKFLADGPLRYGWRFVPTASPKVWVTYVIDDGVELPASLDILVFRGAKISSVVSFIGDEFVKFCGL
ncbi:sigma-70 family RNA polymerase sigma factor [Herbidospora cretacea]|uniref:sigma-70 family RNA polymerase sigma factor n=1 Tax=Herbidospora cretacea TaxID=28444 RepID=UPI0004C366A3|nr:sigma-70 family RNA polymerase sigma factor [Herbidospora cretacea]